MLAAFAYMHRGGVIDHPKTWLTNTLCHKHNDNLRKKYRSPVTVCLDESAEVAEDEDEVLEEVPVEEIPVVDPAANEVVADENDFAE